MRRTMILFVVALSFLSVGCVNTYFAERNLQASLVVTVERQIGLGPNELLAVYANGFAKNVDELVFQCPCYIGQSVDSVSVQVESDLFKLRLLPRATYVVNVRYLVPTSEQK